MMENTGPGFLAPPLGTLTDETISEGMHVLIHYRLQEDMTGVVKSIRRMGRWATVNIDGYDGELEFEALIEEMDEIA